MKEGVVAIDLSKKRNKGSTPRVTYLDFLVALEKGIANGLTHSKIAQAFDITERQAEGWRNGQIIPSRDGQARIVKWLENEVSYKPVAEKIFA